ncbi:SAM-dependent methyltransferase [Paenibacillus pinistramenti]|uniref:SAM-dependent methyltransferase n=1 Tax=Paenibacillus pinistramenti TaxID=1768003 RepID=UPI001109C78D|nr:SAM-dependent methyltransferase [Paenibacillus pinistramenti]
MNKELQDRQTGDTGAETDSRATSSRWICTSNHGFFPYAQEELRRKFGSLKSQVLESGEVGLVTLPAGTEQVLEQLQGEPPMFLRHLFPVQTEVKLEPGDTPHALLDRTVEAAKQQLLSRLKNQESLPQENEGLAAAVQVRKSGESLWAGSALELKEEIETRWCDASPGLRFVSRDADLVLSVFAGEESLYAGISAPSENLSDWNGGAIRFQREEGQISRAKFKLLEAERVFEIDFAGFKHALDIGAAPGGWTSFLLDRGLSVTAVDPAEMNAELLRNPRLTYLKKNADSVSFGSREFDLLVCDMSWSPKLTAKMVINLLDSLAPGGTAVVTIKLLSKKPLALIKEIIAMYTDARLQVIRAKQLFHNRDEITLYMIKY